jgi:drug/metabolite transporter (DMT)-like permease
LPDLQAEIKVNFKPAPTEMMAEINKWCALFSLIICLVTWSLWSFIIYLSEHFSFTIDLILMSIVSGFGQFFIYRMIKQFKQHFVPFTISSRKILTVAISIVFYGHQTNWIQILGICVVLFTIFV